MKQKFYKLLDKVLWKLGLVRSANYEYVRIVSFNLLKRMYSHNKKNAVYPKNGRENKKINDNIFRAVMITLNGGKKK